MNGAAPVILTNLNPLGDLWVTGGSKMPTVSWFYGIASVCILDHPPPHFQAVYGEHEANIAIETGEVIEGYLPPTAARLVKQWAVAHKAELKANWDRARAKIALERIVGLDAD